MTPTPMLRSPAERRRANAARVRALQCKRFVAGLWLLLIGVTAANYYWGWGIGSPYTKELMVVAFAAMGVWMLKWGPSIWDMKVHRKLQRFRETLAWREGPKRERGDPDANAS